MEIISSAAPVTLRNRFASIYRNEIEDNLEWFDDNSIGIREFVSPGSTAVPDPTSPPPETPTGAQDLAAGKSSGSPTAQNDYAVLLQILALSVSVKFFDIEII